MQVIDQVLSQKQLGIFYFERGDMKLAVETLEPLLPTLLNEKNINEYLEIQNILLRGYAELLEFDKIRQAKEVLQDGVLRQGLELNSKTFYTFGLCASYRDEFDTSISYCQKALEIALQKNSKEDICYAITGLAIGYYNQSKLSEALKEIYNLQVFWGVMEIPKLRLSAQILNAKIYRKLGKYEQALEMLWQCYDLLKNQKNHYMHLLVLYSLALTYKEAKDIDQSRSYLNLAKRAIDPENMKRLNQQIEILANEIGEDDQFNYDLIFNAESKLLIEKRRGKINLKNQFILLDLLSLFLSNPGAVYSKEELVKKVWRQTYHPDVHDNKIYVTIKRLRRLIEPEYEKPRYLFRGKNGYYLNKNAKILIQNEKQTEQTNALEV